MPYKYYGIFLPKDNYVVVKDPIGIDIFWISDSIIVRIEDSKGSNYKIINKSENLKMYDYNKNEEKYIDIIWTGKDKNSTFKEQVSTIGISFDGSSVFVDRKKTSTLSPLRSP
jgi:hypothetical protein